MTFVTVEGYPKLGDNQPRTCVGECGMIVGRNLLSLILLAGIGSVGLIPAQAKDLAVISNKGSAMQAIALADLVKVCKGETQHWPDGRPVTFIMLDPQSPEMKLVVQKVRVQGRRCQRVDYDGKSRQDESSGDRNRKIR